VGWIINGLSLKVATMQFTQKLREAVKNGHIVRSVRIWTQARFKVKGRYRLDDGCVVIDHIHEIEFHDIS